MKTSKKQSSIVPCSNCEKQFQFIQEAKLQFLGSKCVWWKKRYRKKEKIKAFPNKIGTKCEYKYSKQKNLNLKKKKKNMVLTFLSEGKVLGKSAVVNLILSASEVQPPPFLVPCCSEAEPLVLSHESQSPADRGKTIY